MMRRRGGEATEPRVAGPADIDGVVGTLVGAFFDDPVWSWAFPDIDRRSDQHTEVFTVLVTSAVAHKWVWLTEGYGVVAVWIPPGIPELTADEATYLTSLLGTIAPDRTASLEGMFDAFEQAHPHDEPHFYLSLLGTSPARRGEGLGMGLLAATLDKIDAVGAPAYLESSNPINVARYESVGFSPLAEVSVSPQGPRFTGMWRPPGL